MPRRILAALVAALSLLALPAAAQAAKAKPSYYVSLGDSYAAGYQRFSATDARTTRDGFAYQVVGKAKARGYKLKLVNFGCGGETTVSILKRKTKCGGLGPGGVDYAGQTQATAAERFLRKHRGQVKLITVSIGGNDVTSCVREADPVACVGPAMDKRQGQRQEAAQAPAQGRRPEDPHRRHHLPRRDPRLLGRRRTRTRTSRSSPSSPSSRCSTRR